MNKIFCLSRAESAIAFSRLHPEAAKEINPDNPVNPVEKKLLIYILSLKY